MSFISKLLRRSAAPSAEGRIVLDDAAAGAVRMIAESTLAGTWARMSRAAGETEIGALADAEEALADALVRYALAAPGAPSAGELRGRTRETRERIRAVGADGEVDADELMLLAPVVVERTLQRAALEACGQEVRLLIERRGRMSLEARPVEPWVALGMLEPEAVSRAVHWTSADPLLDVEMDAASWWIARWSAPAATSDVDLEKLRRMYVRAQEWALADRVAASLREPVLARLLRERAHDGWPARQREVLERLPGSVVGVFTAQGLDGAVAGTAVSAEDGRELPLLYDVEGGMEEGDLLIGRLLPFGDGRWFCSHGVEAVSPEEVDPDRLLRTWGELRRELPDAVALEGATARHVYGRTVPRPVPPAEDPDDAVRRLHALREALAERVPADAAAAEKSSREEALAEVRAGDAALGAWVEALMELARKRVPGRRLDQQRRKRKAKKGKRR